MYGAKGKKLRTVSSAVSGAIHPLIQMGHGVEFGLDALVAEGYAKPYAGGVIDGRSPDISTFHI